MSFFQTTVVMMSMVVVMIKLLASCAIFSAPIIDYHLNWFVCFDYRYVCNCKHHGEKYWRQAEPSKLRVGPLKWYCVINAETKCCSLGVFNGNTDRCLPSHRYPHGLHGFHALGCSLFDTIRSNHLCVLLWSCSPCGHITNSKLVWHII